MSRRYAQDPRELATLEDHLANFDAAKAAKRLFLARLQILLILLGIFTFLYYKNIP